MPRVGYYLRLIAFVILTSITNLMYLLCLSILVYVDASLRVIIEVRQFSYDVFGWGWLVVIRGVCIFRCRGLCVRVRTLVLWRRRCFRRAGFVFIIGIFFRGRIKIGVRVFIIVFSWRMICFRNLYLNYIITNIYNRGWGWGWGWK